MKRTINILLGCLIFWFSLDITGFSLGKFCLVESPGITSPDTAWWVIFIVCSILFLKKEKFGKYIITVFLFAWAIIQYFCHWHYTIFGATEIKLSGYNKYFANTYHIVPSSNRVLIPDLYHIILHISIFSLIVLMIAYIMLTLKRKRY